MRRHVALYDAKSGRPAAFVCVAASHRLDQYLGDAVVAELQEREQKLAQRHGVETRELDSSSRCRIGMSRTHNPDAPSSQR